MPHTTDTPRCSHTQPFSALLASRRYTLSLIWLGRVGHYAIDVDDTGVHYIRGNERGYRFLNDIVRIHEVKPITDKGDRLLFACSKNTHEGEERTDLAELMS
jgi:hypothetical protein